MSLKSFDKFCEDMILKGPGSDKIIYDERQKIMQMNIGIEALLIFGGAAILNCFLMDLFYQYAESYTMPLVLIMLFCAYYYNLRCAAKDCLVGINGVRPLKYSAVFSIFFGIIMFLKYLFSEKENFPTVNGQLSDDLFFLVALIFVIVYGITMLILVRRVEKKKKEEKPEQADTP